MKGTDQEVEGNFNPNLASYPFSWIPQGVFYDLMDTSFDATAVEDQVSDYTNQQMFNAFQPSIFSLQDYRVKLLQTTSNPTSGFVPNLFYQYGY